MKRNCKGMKLRGKVLALLLTAVLAAALPVAASSTAETSSGTMGSTTDGTDDPGDITDDSGEITDDPGYAMDGSSSTTGGSNSSTGGSSSAADNTDASDNDGDDTDYTNNNNGTDYTADTTDNTAAVTPTPAAATSTTSSTTSSTAMYAADSVTNDHEIADPSVVQTNAIANWPQGKDIDADYACLMDANTGAVLYAKNKDTQTPPASITKIMTCLIALENGDLNAQVTMTSTGTQYAVDGSSNLYTQVGEVFTLKDMLYGMMLKSANDMATQIAEYIGGGSIDHFIDMMNQKAAELGCKGTHFVNACGMPADGHVTTAYDMCLITQAALKNDTFRQLIGTKEYTIPATNMTEARSFQNHHEWVVNPSEGPRGFVGGKTGYTDAALNTLVSVVDRDGMELIAVTLHDQGSDKCRNDSAYLFQYGYQNFHEVPVDQGDGVLEGGAATLPMNVSADQITKQTADKTDPTQGEEVETTYLLGEQMVGKSLMTKAAYNKANGIVTPAVTSVPEPAVSSEAESVESAESAEPAIGGTRTSGTTSGKNLSAGNKEKTEEAQVVLPSGIVMNRGLFIAMAVLSSLILVGIIAIIITVIMRRRRY